jgi:hypothetical protein
MSIDVFAAANSTNPRNSLRLAALSTIRRHLLRLRPRHPAA